jgi:hypothetical protein
LTLEICEARDSRSRVCRDELKPPGLNQNEW